MRHYSADEKLKLRDSLKKLEIAAANGLSLPDGVDLRSIRAAVRRSFTLDAEMQNHSRQVQTLRPPPHEIPVMQNLEFGYFIQPKYESGGDHIAFLDFKNRFPLDTLTNSALVDGNYECARNLYDLRYQSGFLIMDVEGDRDTDAFTAGNLHHAFFALAMKYLESVGKITADLLEDLNVRAIQSISIMKTATLIYGSVDENGVVKYYSAGHPHPSLFSHSKNSFVQAGNSSGTDFESSLSIGIGAYSGHPFFGLIKEMVVKARDFTLPQNSFAIQGRGDIMLLATDGVLGHKNARGVYYFPDRAQQLLSSVKNQSASNICEALKADLKNFGRPSDDMSSIVMKKK